MLEHYCLIGLLAIALASTAWLRGLWKLQKQVSDRSPPSSGLPHRVWKDWQRLIA